jgi:hypothetical protein
MKPEELTGPLAKPKAVFKYSYKNINDLTGFAYDEYFYSKDEVLKYFLDEFPKWHKENILNALNDEDNLKTLNDECKWNKRTLSVSSILKLVFNYNKTELKKMANIVIKNKWHCRWKKPRR